MTEDKYGDSLDCDGPSAFAPARLAIIQPTPFCNINCSYCYLAERSNPKRLNIDTVRAIIRFLADVPKASEPLTICWHAGEPLTVPICFYEDAFQEFSSSQIVVRQNIQTNGTLIDEEWCRFFKKWSVQIGLSIDGPKSVHDSHRLDRAGNGTFDRVIRGMTKLREHGIPFSSLAVLTSSSLSQAPELWNFFKSTGTKYLGFNIDEQEGVNVTSTLFAVEQQERLKRFFGQIADLHRPEGMHEDDELDCRELKNMRNHLTASHDTQMIKGDNVPGTIWNFDFEGNVTTFSPELLGQKHLRYGTFAWGNVHTNKWTDVASHEGFKLAWKDIREGVELCRKSCEYFSVCGGGCPSNKLAELGTFRGAKTRCCQLNVQAIADVMIERLEREI